MYQTLGKGLFKSQNNKMLLERVERGLKEWCFEILRCRDLKSSHVAELHRPPGQNMFR